MQSKGLTLIREVSDRSGVVGVVLVGAVLAYGWRSDIDDGRLELGASIRKYS